MSIQLLAKTDYVVSNALCKISSQMALKHAVACEKARKMYLSAMYGEQPPKGEYWGWILSAVADVNVVTVEVRLTWGRGTSLFELPLHVFQKDGMPLESAAAIEDLSGYVVKLSVADRYNFNGITLSDVTAVELTTKSNTIISPR